MSRLAELLKESWALVEDQQDKLAGYFYARMFMSAPALRDLFPVTMDVQRTRLLEAIVTAVQAVDNADRFDEILLGLGRDHRKFEVEPAHYEVVGEALLHALRTFAGDRWSGEYEQAWSQAYQLMANRMISGAAADSSPPYQYAEVIQHERRSRDIAVFTCRTPEPLGHRAGQYVSIECHYRPRLWRVFSIANAPRNDHTLEFHVRGRGTGVSGALVRRLQPGDRIRVAAPMGSMTLDRTSTRDILGIAGGTGLAPIKALVEEVGRYEADRPIQLFVGARHREDLYAWDELRQLAQRLPALRVVPVCNEDPTFPGERGPVSEVVGRYGPWDSHDVLLSGPPAMVQATLDMLTQLRVPPERIRYDTFSMW